jgi:hypothetical protein
MQINYVTGDATIPQGAGKRMIAHVVDDAGSWRTEFVLALSNRWPQIEDSYRTWIRGRADNTFALGDIQIVDVNHDLSVVNMVAQRRIHASRRIDGPINYQAFRKCLVTLHIEAASRGASIHMPRLGSSLADGNWTHIAPLIQQWLVDAGTPVTVYDLPSSA